MIKSLCIKESVTARRQLIQPNAIYAGVIKGIFYTQKAFSVSKRSRPAADFAALALSAERICRAKGILRRKGARSHQGDPAPKSLNCHT